MAEHTPGPWEARGYTVFREGETTLSVAIAEYHRKERVANARLIAAAPDLLAACELAVAAMGNMDAANRIRAAIAKAKGETP